MQNETNYANSADGRALGFFQLSIATSLAIESAVGIHPDLPRPVHMPIKQYQSVWINMRTLFRNIWGAIPSEIAPQMRPDELAQLLHEEMQLIPDVLQNYAGGVTRVGVTYYMNRLDGLERKYPEADLRTNSTPKKEDFANLQDASINLLMQADPTAVKLENLRLSGEAKNALIITHHPYDLLSASNFSNLTLLESHTGKIKPKALWYTKYYNGRDLSMIPFTEELLQVFGDLDLFSPLDHNLRKAIVELATRRNWSSVTTRARIVDGINELRNPAYVLKLKKLYGVLV